MVGIRSFPFGMAYFQGRAVSFREGSTDVTPLANCQVTTSRPRHPGGLGAIVARSQGIFFWEKKLSYGDKRFKKNKPKSLFVKHVVSKLLGQPDIYSNYFGTNIAKEMRNDEFL